MIPSPEQKQILLNQITDYVTQQFDQVEAGHDMSHIYRVLKNALLINETENGNAFLIEAAALLHDICDEKLFDKKAAETKTRIFLESIHVDGESIDALFQIIHSVSFGNAINQREQLSLEQKVVRDADRLDAMGAIGIARAFSYGGLKKRAFFDIHIPPVKHTSSDSYRKSNAPTINHFYEKLLLLKDMMETEKGKQLAEERHQFMLLYLKQFYKEIDSEGFQLP